MNTIHIDPRLTGGDANALALGASIAHQIGGVLISKPHGLAIRMPRSLAEMRSLNALRRAILNHATPEAA